MRTEGWAFEKLYLSFAIFRQIEEQKRLDQSADVCQYSLGMFGQTAYKLMD